jgi:hypothetical protein
MAVRTPLTITTSRDMGKFLFMVGFGHAAEPQQMADANQPG